MSFQAVYTYIMKIGLSRHGKERLAYDESLSDHKSSNYSELETITHNGIDRMLMQSDLRDIYHSVKVIGFNSSANGNLIGKVYVQLSDNTDEKRLREIVKKYLRMYNFSLGGTDLFATPVQAELDAYDFDECQTEIYQDCSENAHCFNLQGTYTCSCREGFADISDNAIYPGRDCIPEQLGCETCHYHGTCFTKSDDQVLCECFQWYTGKSCQINLKCE